MIEHENKQLSIRKQCLLIAVTRSQIYYSSKRVDENMATIMNEMRDIYEKYPFYGYRRMHVLLTQKGYVINRKRVQRLMKIAGIQAIYQKKKTTIRNAAHKIYPYLLRDIKIDRPNVAWGVDITYIRVKRGFVYLVGIIDIFSRRIMGWNLSVSLETKPCLDAYSQALLIAKPDILNSDQGCQFTSEAWTSKVANDGIKVSMDGKGRWADNVHIERFWRSIKYEAVYLQSFESVSQARVAIGQYIEFYNHQRPHQTLGYKTPDVFYRQHLNDNEREAINKTQKFPASLVGEKIKNSQIQATFWS